LSLGSCRPRSFRVYWPCPTPGRISEHGSASAWHHRGTRGTSRGPS
jgi:hypothetical protein